MAWTWVKNLKNPLGQTITAFVPSVSPETMGLNASNYTVEASPYESDANYERDKAIVESFMVDGAAIFPDFRNLQGFDAAGKTWSFPVSSGGITATVNRIQSNDRIDFTLCAFSFGSQLMSLNPTTYPPVGVWSGYPYRASYCGFVIAYNAELERLHVGIACVQQMNVGQTKDTYTVNVYKNFTANLWELFSGYIPTPSGGDPYEDGGYSDLTEDPQGDFDFTSDDIDVPTTPTLSAQSAGLISLYTVDSTNIQKFADYLLDPDSAYIELTKVWDRPSEAILCLNYFPFTPAAATTPTEISFGKTGTGADGHLLDAQFVEVDCGAVTVNTAYGSCLDYSPYTTISLVLPFASAVELDPDEVTGKTLQVVYKVDCYTGSALAIVYDGKRVLMQVPAMMALPLPITASDYSGVVGAMASQAITISAGIAAAAVGAVATPAAAVALGGSMMAATAGNVMGAKVHYSHGGSGGLGTGLFGVQKPYLIMKRPRQCLPENNGNYQGYPTFVTESLGNVSGFTKVAEIHLESLDATDGEKRELETILKGGVFF